MASLRRPDLSPSGAKKRERERSIPLTSVHKFHSRREVINVITSEKLKGVARGAVTPPFSHPW